MAAKGKGKGKQGKASVRGAHKRHDKSSDRKNSIEITRPALRRLARRGGVKRIGMGATDEMRDFADMFLENVVRASCALCDVTKRKTVTTMDVIYALKRNGRTIYGYGA